MAQTNTPKLDMGDQFPSLQISMLGGETFTFPDDLNTEQTILLLYRGKW